MKKWFYYTREGESCTFISLLESKGMQNPGRGDFILLGKSCYRYLELDYDSGGRNISQDTLAYLARPHFPATLEGAMFDSFVISDKKIAIIIIDAAIAKEISGLSRRNKVHILPQFFYNRSDNNSLAICFGAELLEACRQLEEHGENHLVIESGLEEIDFERIDFDTAGKLRLKRLFREKSRSGKSRRGIVLFTTILILNAAFWVFSFREMKKKENYAEKLSLELENNSFSTNDTGIETEARLARYRYLLSLKPDSLIRFFYSLDKAVVGNVEISSFSLSNGVFSFSGYADDTLALVKEMNEVPLFSDIATTRISRDSKTGREEFTIRGKYHE